MPCHSCPKPAVYRVAVIHNGDADPIVARNCCRDHLADTLDALIEAYPGHRIMPGRL